MNRFTMAAGCLTAILSTVPAAAMSQERPARPDGPLAQAVALSRDADVDMRYAYTRHVVVDAEDEHLDRLERFDPRLDDGARWTLLEVDGDTPSPADIEDYDPDETGDFGGSEAFDMYRDMVEDIEIDSAMLIEQTADFSLYQLRETKAGFLDRDEAEFAEYLTTQVRVDTRGAEPFVQSFDIRAERPFEPSMLAEMDRFEMRFDFMRHPDSGDILPAEVVIGISVDALVFISVDADTKVTFSEYEPVGSR